MSIRNKNDWIYTWPLATMIVHWCRCNCIKKNNSRGHYLPDSQTPCVFKRTIHKHIPHPFSTCAVDILYRLYQPKTKGLKNDHKKSPN